MSEMEGIVEMKQAGQDAFAPAQPNSLLFESAQVQTGTNGRVRLDISTGTIVRVAPSSVFTLISNTPTEDGLITKLQLALGEMYIVLSGGSLDVETPTGTASVRGSYMSVSYSSTGSVRITCLEGHCSLATPAGRVDIIAGQSAEVIGAGLPPQVGVMSDQDIQEWLDNCPEAEVVVSALEDEQTNPLVSPLLYVPPANKPANPKEPESTSTPTPIPTPTNTPTVMPTTPVPSLVPTVSITSISPSVSAIVGELVTFTINVGPSAGGPTPTGTVGILNGANTICTAPLDATGNATCIGGFPAAGAASFLARYYGDGNYLIGDSTSFGYSVAQASTSVNFSFTLPPSMVNEPVSFTADVVVATPGAGSPTGTMTFSELGGDGSCIATSTPWTCSITFAFAGSKAVTATYSGDANFIGSVSPSSVSHTVNQATTTVVISNPTNGSPVSNPAPFTAIVNATPGPSLPTGSVTFTDDLGDNCTATSAPWTCSMTFSLNGTRTVTAAYSGDANFVNSASASVTVIVP